MPLKKAILNLLRGWEKHKLQIFHNMLLGWEEWKEPTHFGKEAYEGTPWGTPQTGSWVCHPEPRSTDAPLAKPRGEQGMRRKPGPAACGRLMEIPARAGQAEAEDTRTAVGRDKEARASRPHCWRQNGDLLWETPLNLHARLQPKPLCSLKNSQWDHLLQLPGPEELP